jgi:site-specific DNA recombinase
MNQRIPLAGPPAPPLSARRSPLAFQGVLLALCYPRVLMCLFHCLETATFVSVLILALANRGTVAAEVRTESTTIHASQPVVNSHDPSDDRRGPQHDRDRLPDRRRLQIAPRRKGPRNKADIERDKRERWDRTCREVDEVYAEYLARFPRDQATVTGVVYARFSTRFQDSIADQVRTVLEHALKLRIFVPREFVFFDLAIRGFKRNRDGLARVESVLNSKRARVLLLFSTSRLFRKTYRTLEFVDRIHKGLEVRCIFVKSGVDTNDKERWEVLLATQSMLDQFVVTMNIANIQAAQEGLLNKQLVFGTVSFGYTGIAIDGQFTKLGRPRRRIAIDPETSRVVAMIFSWYVESELTINEIVHRLNSDPDMPLPSGATSGQWNRRVVAKLLRNPRYRGLWRYGVVESVYLPDKDYTRQRLRAEPLKEIQLDELRIESDEIWFAAQRRLAQRSVSSGGRPAVDPDRCQRPKVINDFFICPPHSRMHVSGSYGKYMHCPVCNRLPWEERNLVSDLDRGLAFELVCRKLSELLEGDQKLIEDALAACALEVEAAQRPDPARLVPLKARLDQLQRSIDFTRRNPGESEEEQADAARFVKEQQRDRAIVAAEKSQLEALMARVPKMPGLEEVQDLVAGLSKILLQAAEGVDEMDQAALRQILELLTGGTIEMYQMGERLPQRGWLQGRFDVRLLPYLVEHLTGAAATLADTVPVVIDFVRTLSIDVDAAYAWQLAMAENWQNQQIATELGCCKTYVTNLLKHAAAERGVPFEDGRKRRARVKRPPRKPRPFPNLSDEVKRRLDSGEVTDDVAASLEVGHDTLRAAYVWWHASRGLPVPKGGT